MRQIYRYVGSAEILRRSSSGTGVVITSIGQLNDWVRTADRDAVECTAVVATFVIDSRGRLRLADRRSEHVACADGDTVLSAGEMSFVSLGDIVEVDSVTNLSTGYCPEPESWDVVASALDSIGVAHPGCFTTEIIFRRCPACGQTNVVKDEWFVCAVCDRELPRQWNLSEPANPG